MTDATPREPTRKRARSGWARAGLWMGGVSLALVLLLASVVWWAGTQGSLPRALAVAQRLLPADQSLAFTDVQGSITGGGRIARLQWSKPGTTVTIEDLRLEWSLRQLLGRDLQVRVLSMRNAHVLSTPQPDQPDEPPFVMPEDVSLPIKVTLPLTITRLQLESVDAAGLSSMQVLDGIVALYRYDGELHVLRLDSIRYGQSSLQGQAQLHARDLTVSSQLVATLRDLVPDVPFAMTARLAAKGTLAGGDAAALDVQLDAAQQVRDAQRPTPLPGGAQLRAQAAIHPWRKQLAQQLELTASGIDAHAFAAAAPVTALRGRASLKPVTGTNGATWDAVLDFANDQPGAWDQLRLPLRQLAARARVSLELVLIESARVDLAGRAPAGHVTLTGQVPLKQLPKTTMQLDLQKVDLQPLMTSLPRTSLTGPLAIKPWQQDSWQAVVDVRNALPGPLDRERLPMDSLLADIRFAPERWHVEKFDLRVGSTGRVQAQGEFTPASRALDVHAELQRLPLRQIHRKMASDLASQLSGKLAVAGDLQQGLAFNADIASDAAGVEATGSEWEIRAVNAKGKWTPTRLTIERMHLDAMQATLDGGPIDVVLPAMDSIKANITATAPGVLMAADATMTRQSGGGNLSVSLESAEQLVAWLQGLPGIGEQLPDLKATGAATFEADWQGGWRQWLAGIENPASQPSLKLNAVARTAGLHVELPAAEGEKPPMLDVQKLALDLHGNLAAATLAIDGDVRANETRAVMDIRMQANQVRGTGGAPRWNIAIGTFTAAATLPDETQPWRLQLSDNLQVVVQSGATLEVQATAGTATVSAPTRNDATSEPLQLAWQPVVWRRTARGSSLQSTGTATGIQPAWLDMILKDKVTKEGPLTGAGMRSDLVLSGEWDIQMQDVVNITAHLQRDGGDLFLLDPETAAGIRALDVKVQSLDEKVELSLDWDTERAGIITARVSTRLQQQADGWTLPDDAPLSGTIKASVKDLNSWAFLAPPGWRIQGALDADLRLGGTVQKPRADGSIDGNELNLRSVLDGVDLYDGTLHATLTGTRMQVDELTFQGGTGSSAYIRGFSGNRTDAPSARGNMLVTGSVDWSRVARASEAESGIAMDMEAKLQRMQVLVRRDRQMTLSGDLSAKLEQGQLVVRGDIHVDRATIKLPEAGAPTLSDDVVIVRNEDLKNAGKIEARQARGELHTRKPIDMEVRLDLGNDLALQGEGITTRLQGELTVRNAAYGGDPVSVFGEVRTDEGRYRGLGQALNVETGVVRFNGPYTNPSLDLLAVRPEIAVRAGVHVTGTLMAPRVQLFSDPDLPEGEKLSWVVMGRDPAGTGSTGIGGAQVQQAAVSLAAGQLSGRLASGLGVDELGLGTDAVTIGKRISNELYLTYEVGLAGAASTLFIFYDITRKLTLRAQNVRATEGYSNAVDLVYTIKFD
jgi:translocation and assembly module TamB